VRPKPGYVSSVSPSKERAGNSPAAPHGDTLAAPLCRDIAGEPRFVTSCNGGTPPCCRRRIDRRIVVMDKRTIMIVEDARLLVQCRCPRTLTKLVQHGRLRIGGSPRNQAAVAADGRGGALRYGCADSARRAQQQQKRSVPSRRCLTSKAR